MNNKYFLTFKNTHEAIKAEKTIECKGIYIEIMPTPTEVTKSCGICICIKEDDIKIILEMIDSNLIGIDSIYYKKDKEYKKLSN
ncbi:hypothetical protein SH2C18_13000 [Clostridium sediminicola]|uniref:DUF3343 domain-containing protein n=1 Tax=Clostridium sediminicola TaxID=3114879 RepID=UPI0031F22385